MIEKNKREKILSEIIEKIIFHEEIEKGIKQIEQIERIIEEKNKVKDLQKNTRFLKEILTLAKPLIKTIKFAKNEGKEIDIVSMFEILTGILVILEKRNFIKIIKEN